MQTRFWTAPNILSLYRIAAAPVIAGCLLRGSARWYIGLLIVSLLSDVADGWIARKYNLHTEIGARLDSFADLLTVMLAVGGVFRFHWSDVSQPPRAAAFFIYLACYGALMLTGLLRFRRQPSLHTYMAKATAYLQSACLVSVFLIGFKDVFYYLALGWGVVASIEEIAILIVLKEPRSDIKGLYWVLKERKADP